MIQLHGANVFIHAIRDLATRCLAMLGHASLVLGRASLGRASLGRASLGRASLALAIVLSFASPLRAVEPDEILPDAKLEVRARALSSGLRCMVCQNQSIDDSHAPLARDLRMLVREQLQSGKSDDEIRDYLVARYGAFVLLKPPFEAETLILWVSPILVFLLGGGALLYRARRAPEARVKPLSAEEEKRLRELAGKR